MTYTESKTFKKMFNYNCCGIIYEGFLLILFLLTYLQQFEKEYGTITIFPLLFFMYIGVIWCWRTIDVMTILQIILLCSIRWADIIGLYLILLCCIRWSFSRHVSSTAQLVWHDPSIYKLQNAVRNRKEAFCVRIQRLHHVLNT